MHEEKKPFIALSLDGGGFRGLYTASLLQRLSTLFTKEEIDIGSKFSLIAGTSTGGILACALASGVPLKKIIELYTQKGSAIFSKPKPIEGCSKLAHYFQLILWAIFRTPSCNQAELQKSLEEVFYNKTLAQIYEERGVALCIPTINYSNNNPVVLKTPHNEGKDRDNSVSLVEACLATSAAPIFFSAAKIKNWSGSKSDRIFIDGGLWANNPILIALTESLMLAEPDQDIVIISIGTAASPSGNLDGKQNLSALSWGFGSTVVESALDSQSIGFNYIANFLKKPLSNEGRKVDIIRLPELPRNAQYIKTVHLDKVNSDSIRALQEAANSDAENIHGLFHRNNSELKNLDLIFSNNN